MMSGCFSKVIWAEGMMLGQQHLQCWEDFLQHQRHLMQTHTTPFPWGIALIEIDDDYLPQGLFRLNRCVALLKDGRWVDFNHQHDGVLTLDVPKDHTQTMSISLALADGDKAIGLPGYPETDATVAWHAEHHLVRDKYDKTREREVLLARQNVQLIVDAPSLPRHSLLKIAELEFNSQQSSFCLNKHFYPSALKVCAAQGLLSWLRQLTQDLAIRLNSLKERRETQRHLHNHLSYSELIYFNLVKSLATYWSKFMLLSDGTFVHPYVLYGLCCELLGELWSYLDAPTSQTRFPVYAHDNLSEVFALIRSQYDELITHVIPTNGFEITLKKTDELQFESDLIKKEQLEHQQFYLVFYHERMSQTVIDTIHAHVKIAAPTKLMNIVHTFTQGVELHHLTSPDNGAVIRKNHHYFALNKNSPHWQDILVERRIAMFLGAELASHSLELMSYE